MKLPTHQDVETLLKRGVAEIISNEHLTEALTSGKKLRVKLGIDPTSPTLHLGLATVLKKLKQFQDLGHTVILLVGDFTARIGDPSGQSHQRRVLTVQEIHNNLKGYQQQIGRFLDLRKTEWEFNSKWYKKEKFDFFLKLLSSVSYNQIIERDDFQKRIKERQEIAQSELVYPLLQGYDSVVLRADVELGGIDQKFNLVIARKIQRFFKQQPEDVMMLPLLIGLDGKRKMSKSYGNTIDLNEKPASIFGKIMSLPDGLLSHYFELLTDVAKEEILRMSQKIRKDSRLARDYKFILATKVVSWLHSSQAAEQASREFEAVFKEKKLPQHLLTINLKKGKYNLLDLLNLSGLVVSKSEARRLVKQGGVDVNGRTIKDWKQGILIQKDTVLKVGKYKFFKVQV